MTEHDSCGIRELLDGTTKVPADKLPVVLTDLDPT